MTIKVYGVPVATCVKRVLTTLKEKGLPYEMVVLDFKSLEHKSEEYLKKQPFGVMPVLEDDGFIVYESRAICRYLETKYKGQGTELIPTDVQELAIMEQGASIETSYFEPNAGGLAVELVFKPMKGLTTDHEKVKELTAKLTGYLDVYEKILSKQAYIGGNKLSVVDIYHLPYGSMLFAPQVNLGHLITDRPHVKEWWGKISSLPSWKEVNGH